MKNKKIFSKLFLLSAFSFILNSGFSQNENKTSPDNFTNGTIVSSENATIRSQLKPSGKPYDETILGIYYANSQPEASQPYFKQNPIVLTGITFVKYNSENGKIKKGDFITSSSEAGTGMKANNTGIVLGVALEDASSSSGLIKIRILIQYIVFPDSKSIK